MIAEQEFGCSSENEILEINKNLKNNKRNKQNLYRASNYLIGVFTRFFT